MLFQLIVVMVKRLHSTGQRCDGRCKDVAEQSHGGNVPPPKTRRCASTYAQTQMIQRLEFWSGLLLGLGEVCHFPETVVVDGCCLQMDQYLRCNSLRCRQVLTTQAVVTNCSHIFCVDWYPSHDSLSNNASANKLFTDSRTCPLCELAHGEPDVPSNCSIHNTRTCVWPI